MELALPEWPAELGAQLAQVSALVTILIGLVFLATAKPLAQRWGFDAREGRSGATGELRVAGGFMAGVGLAAYLFDQPLIYVMLGAAHGFAAFGRVLSMMSASDRSNGLINFLLLLLQAALSVAALYWLFDVWTADAAFQLPQEGGAYLVFLASAVSMAIGFVVMFAPGISMLVSGLTATAGRERIFAAVRSSGGFLLGAACVALLTVNPFAELAFGAAYMFSTAARVVVIFADRGRKYFNAIALLFQLAMTCLFIGHVFGYF